MFIRHILQLYLQGQLCLISCLCFWIQKCIVCKKHCSSGCFYSSILTVMISYCRQFSSAKKDLKGGNLPLSGNFSFFGSFVTFPFARRTIWLRERECHKTLYPLGTGTRDKIIWDIILLKLSLLIE